MLKRSLKDLIMDDMEDRIRELSAAAKALVEQVENYTAKAGSRSMLLNAKERMERVLRGNSPPGGV